MCDYSLQNVPSRPAKVGDKLITTWFTSTPTRGFAALSEPNVAVCVLSGTELAFDKDVRWERYFLPFFWRKEPSGKLVRFRQVNVDKPHTHHDAVEFPSGKVVLLTALLVGQRATVLQLPAELKEQVRRAAVEAEPRASTLAATEPWNIDVLIGI